MMLIFSISLMTLMISSLMILMASMLAKKTFMDREKSSPFECGFDPKSSARIPFSLQFFLIAMVFLVFDIEITLILPFIFSLKISNMLSLILIFSFFIMILLIGLYHEWKQGMLNWAL